MLYLFSNRQSSHTKPLQSIFDHEVGGLESPVGAIGTYDHNSDKLHTHRNRTEAYSVSHDVHDPPLVCIILLHLQDDVLAA